MNAPGNGSSPLTRGKPVREFPRLGYGLAHPRSRGENGKDALDAFPDCGSSPLTRGKQPGRPRRGQGNRLIPAHAGKTASSSRTSPAPGGSSPLTRGKHQQLVRQALGAGLIPAHAGKTACTVGRSSGGWAHPRSRGENPARPLPLTAKQGSSPLTRGKRAFRCVPRGHPGLIPAHAGKTSGRAGPAPPDPAHPRSRGENLKQVARDVNKAGSSPLTRGKPGPAPPDPSGWRLIPAHAGKTGSGSPE